MYTTLINSFSIWLIFNKIKQRIVYWIGFEQISKNGGYVKYGFNYINIVQNISRFK
jgi:hypothetical protein